MRQNMRTVLVFIPKSRYIFKEMLDGVQRYFKGSQTTLQIVEYGENENRTDVRKLLAFWQPDGCIVEASYGLPPQLAPGCLRPVPVVYLDPSPRDFGEPILEVRNDEACCGQTAARELLSDDLPNYAFVGYPIRGLSWSDERGDAFAETLRLHNLPCRRFETPRGKASRKNALRKWILDLPKPCGVFAANDFTAEELIGICSTVGVGVPDDIRIVSFDNDEQVCLRTSPTITSLWPDNERAGFLCAETLARKWGNPHLRKCRTLYGLAGIIHRGSSVRPARTGYQVQSAVKAIRDHACESAFSVDDVARAMGCSRRLAEMRFKRETGVSIRDEIGKTRFEHVFALLSSRHEKIEAIASRCGFGTSAALRTAFRKRTGMSLRDWRKEHCH